MPDAVKNATPLSAHISTADHIAGWTKQNAFTGCDSHGLDFSHYIAGAHDPVIAEVDAAIRSAPLEKGFAPKAWQHMTDCSIPKKEDVLSADKMRTIVLMDCPYNMNNKAMGRLMMGHSEDLKTIAKEQGGSRKHHHAALGALNSRITNDYL